MAALDRRGTLVYDVAVKTPVYVATTGANIALSGVQAIDSLTVGNNSERVLVKNQTDPTQNGIYQASTGAWTRTVDASGNGDFVNGSLILVALGTINAGLMYMQTCTDSPIIFGTSLITFVTQSSVQTAQQTATSATNLAIGTGSKVFTTQAGKSFSVNQWVLVQETSNSANQMLGQITAYSGTSLTVSVIATGGSGTHNDWTIVLTNSPAAAGYQPPVGFGNVTGPGSAVSGHLASFADTTGKVIQDAGVLGALAALNTVTAQYLASSAVSSGAPMLNGTIVASVSGNALTFAVKTLAGADPSASDPVYFIFRNATITSGSYSVRTVTAALSTTIPASSTVGSANATPFRVWLTAIDDAGTVSLAVINCLSTAVGPPSTLSIYPLVGWGIASVTAYGAGANSAQVFYGTSAHTSCPYTVLGWGSYEVGSTLAAAGTYATAPTRTSILRAGDPLPGREIQVTRNETGAVNTGTTALPADDTIPLITEGDQFLSQAITPSSSANVLRVDTQAHVVNASDGSVASALFQDSSACLGVCRSNEVSTATPVPHRVYKTVLAGTLSSTTFKLRSGSNSGTTTFNGASSARLYGGALNSFMQVEEIMA